MLEEQEVPGLAPGKYIKISIRDQGRGIATDILPKIFDPYFSTKERGAQKGMGLGLTVSDAIVRKHNGAITVETETGKGSTFHIYLPAAVSAVAEAASKAVKRT
jgi:two-component system cell cycle sensor histidine kinase/response regulator CckA